jgi:protein O-GlcNAc transferase
VRLLRANGVNPYWGEIEHFHNFSRRRLYTLLENHGFQPAEYNVSERYHVCMEVIAVKDM